jgi:hypothetical protein
MAHPHPAGLPCEEEETMKLTRAATVITMLLGASLAAAQEKQSDLCQKYEYAELKDQTKEDLLHDYCLAGGYFRIQLQLSTDLYTVDPVASHNASLQADNCRVQSSRIQRVLQNKYATKDIDCKALEVRWKKENEEYDKKHKQY